MSDSTPSLPQPASIDAALEKFDSTPLFMKSLPTDDLSDAVSALQSLVYDGTPDVVAQNFKEQGNDYFKGRRFREALDFYTQGIDVKPTDDALREVLLCNRAACNLELKNYGSVLRDCSKALNINPQSSKGFYRSSLALLALDRVDEALDCCERCLKYDGDNKGILSVREKIFKIKEERARKEQDKIEKMYKEKEEKRRLASAFKERNLIMVSNEGTSDNPHSPHFDPEDPTGSTLIIPVFFLYPQHATSDIIPTFVEDTPFSAHLSIMFPPGAPAPKWDQAGDYVDGKLVLYAITQRKRLLKVGKKMTLRNVCNAAKAKEGEPKDGLEVKQGCLTFVVLPKGEIESSWVDEFKKTRYNA